MGRKKKDKETVEETVLESKELEAIGDKAPKAPKEKIKKDAPLKLKDHPKFAKFKKGEK